MIDNPILMLNSLYRKLAVLLHPDKNNSMVQAEEAFKCVTQAYTVLLDPVKRQQLFFNRVTPASPNEPVSSAKYISEDYNCKTNRD
jgi:DnaJ-class molecular chaperone